MKQITKPWKLILLALGAVLVVGCGGKSEEGGNTPPADSKTGGMAANSGAKLSGEIDADGSSTVEPITSAIAEEYEKVQTGVKINVGESGTGGGFKKFTNNETALSDASRPMETKEQDEAKKNGVEFIELPIAYDGIAIVIHPSNTFAKSLTVEELKRIWAADSKINNWKDVRPGFPDLPLKLFGPGTASGTFDYFTEAIAGKKGASRADYSASENDNDLVRGVAGEKGGLGYFGYAYFEKNQDKLAVVEVDGGKGPVKPSPETIANGTYQPLSRPLFIYVNRKKADEPHVKDFVKFYLDKVPELVKSVGYVPLPTEVYDLSKKRFEGLKTGSVFNGGAQINVSIKDLMSKESGP